MYRYQRKENFTEELQATLQLQTPTERDEEFWDIAKDLHSYLSKLDLGNLRGFTKAIANGFTIIDLVNMYAKHAEGIRTFNENFLEEDE